ncbi:MAG TPA: DUF4286 family protein, partial [Sediminibacterium sp.]|nr:DUF4286 family protein [Sediminibacterium sp.]
MMLYNVTTHVQHAIAADWLQWMQESHIPAVMQTGCFRDYRILKLLETDESEGLTFAVQYTIDDKELYESYLRLHAPALRQEISSRWGNQVIA